jgi:hypothetical protein
MTDRPKRAKLPRLVGMIAVALALAIAAGCSSSSAGSSSSKKSKPAPPDWVLRGSYKPSIDPANFVATIDNRYFPLVPGTAFHYRGTKGHTAQTDDMVVTDQTKQILGITCTVVQDTVSENGNPVEQTFDWYAQDKQGNVWYMGEDSLEKKNGHFVQAGDSWESGVHGAQPGIIMPADPQPGDVYRQEYYPKGEALDQAHVRRLDASVTVAYGSFNPVLVTEEWSPVEPQLEQKSYVAGIGEIEEHLTEGGHEQFELASVTH